MGQARPDSFLHTLHSPSGCTFSCISARCGRTAALFQAADPEPVQAPANVPWVQMQLEQLYQAPQPRLGSCQNVKQLLQLVLRVLHLLRRLTPQPLGQRLRVVGSWPAVLLLSIHTDSSHLPMCLALQKRTGNQGLCG